MRCFAFKLAVFVAGMWILLLGLGYVGNKIASLDDWDLEEQRAYATLLKSKDRIQAVSLGNSHSDALDFSLIGLEGRSLARAAADLFEVERYVASVADKLTALQTVFVTLSFYSFSRDNSKLESLRMRRINLYAMLTEWVPVTNDARNLVLGKLHAYTGVLSVARPDNWRKVLSRNSEINAAEDLALEGSQSNRISSVTQWGECRHLAQNVLEEHARETARKNAESSRAMAEKHMDLQQDAFKALAATIERLQDKGVRVILLTPPYYKSYTDGFSRRAPDIIDYMHWAVDRLREKYHVEYYDFSSDADLTSRAELFYNSDHVNDCGRKAVSVRLMRAMRYD